MGYKNVEILKLQKPYVVEFRWGKIKCLFKKNLQSNQRKQQNLLETFKKSNERKNGLQKLWIFKLLQYSEYT